MEGPRKERMVIGKAVVIDSLHKIAISKLISSGYCLDTLSCCRVQAGPKGILEHISVRDSKSIPLRHIQRILCAVLL